MYPQIKHLDELKLIGMHLKMNFTNNRTYELWSRFMPRRKEIHNHVDSELFSIEVYAPNYFKSFDAEVPFEKWAAVAVTDFETIPEGMDPIVIEAGLYAVFIHKGPASDGPKTYQYIFVQWLPNSKYELDDRPHFARMGEKYRRDDPESEEKIWIPIKAKENF